MGRITVGASGIAAIPTGIAVGKVVEPPPPPCPVVEIVGFAVCGEPPTDGSVADGSPMAGLRSAILGHSRDCSPGIVLITFDQIPRHVVHPFASADAIIEVRK